MHISLCLLTFYPPGYFVFMLLFLFDFFFIIYELTDGGKRASPSSPGAPSGPVTSHGSQRHNRFRDAFILQGKSSQTLMYEEKSSGKSASQREDSLGGVKVLHGDCNLLMNKRVSHKTEE